MHLRYKQFGNLCYVIGALRGFMRHSNQDLRIKILPNAFNALNILGQCRRLGITPIVNRDPRSNEMQKMRQQLECLQAELLTRSARVSSEEVQRTLVVLSTISDNSKDDDEEVAKEWQHTLLQNTMDKELNELNEHLEQKESEMKLFGGFDAMALKQHFGKKIMELEDEKRTVDRLLAEVESLAANSDGQTQKMQDFHTHKLKALEAQILDLKKKQDGQVQIVKQKQRSDEATKRLQEEIQYIKSQK
ncbi:hypothetical protein MKX01_021892, partial [Papaver californicum]